MITFKDFEKRYLNLRKTYPQIKNCTVSGCKNPRDITEGMGEWRTDTTCAYHRMLFDFWGMDLLPPKQLEHYLKSQKGRRRAFSNWIEKTGKEECDKIVLKMAQEGINWVC